MNVWILIPSRLASTRFPNKPLADIGGRPMVVRVVEQAEKSKVGEVWVAAGDAEIAKVVEAHGHQAVLTDPAIANGSDRIWQAAQRLIEKGEKKPDLIINAQGDEPLLPPELLVEAVEILKAKPEVDVVTFAHPIHTEADINNPTKVKVVTTHDHRALYFSRSPIPHGAGTMLRHIGLYAYRYAALEKYVSTPPGELENIEKLEQLRGLELGLHYHVATTHHEPIGVDTPADLEGVLKLVKLVRE